MRRYTELGRRIRAARQAKEWSQKNLADILGCERQRIILWEQGKHRPNLYYRGELQKLLGIEDFSPDPEPPDPFQERVREIYERRLAA